MKSKLLVRKPIHIVRIFIKVCPHCEESKTNFYDRGRNEEESDKLRAEGKVHPLYECRLAPILPYKFNEGGFICAGHIPCSIEDWRECPLH